MEWLFHFIETVMENAQQPAALSVWSRGFAKEYAWTILDSSPFFFPLSKHLGCRDWEVSGIKEGTYAIDIFQHSYTEQFLNRSLNDRSLFLLEDT